MRLRKLIFLILVCVQLLPAQDSITRADYERALGFLSANVTNKKVFNAYVSTHWFPDSSGLWYTDHSPEGKEYRRIDLPEVSAGPLFDHARVAALLTGALGEEVEPKGLPIDRIEYRSPEELEISVADKKFLLDLAGYTLSTAPRKDPAPASPPETPAPDSSWIAYPNAHNLYLKKPDGSQVRQLSKDGQKNYTYASWYGWADILEGENAERPENFYADWSPDGKWLHANVVNLHTASKMYLLDWSVDTLYRPRLLSYYRGSPGDTGMVYLEPTFFNAATGHEVRPDLPRATHINAITARWSDATPGRVFLRRQSRGFQDIHLYTFDLETENLKTLYSETSETNIDNFVMELAEESGQMFFLSEKSGWRQLHTLDLETKAEKMLTSGGYYINSIERIDEENEKIYFLASGKESGRNPYFQHLYRIDFDGGNLSLLTPENRHHLIDLSPDGSYFVDNFSTVDTETKTVLRRTEDGEILLQITEASVVDLPNWSPPETFTAIAKDGKTTIYGAVWKPINFDPAQKYPVLDASYTGPHTQRYPKDFGQATSLQSYAELGFLVVAIDGLGSSGRSKEFHNHSYRNLGGGLDDHVGFIRQLGERYHWVDTTRVGIFGHSAGGYDAGRAVLAYPDFYKVAVASSADHDHRMEKAWWPEMYMGWPVDSIYEQQSNITLADRLKGKLLITHGGIDENVNPSATFKLAEALIRADKQFDMLILPSQRHGYTGQALKYFSKRRWNYFVEHLRGVEPIWDFVWE